MLRTTASGLGNWKPALLVPAVLSAVMLLGPPPAHGASPASSAASQRQGAANQVSSGRRAGVAAVSPGRTAGYFNFKAGDVGVGMYYVEDRLRELGANYLMERTPAASECWYYAPPEKPASC